MKKLFFCLIFWACSAHSQPITLSFKDAPLQTFLQSVYRDVLKSNFLISPALSKQGQTVTLELVFNDRDDLRSRMPSIMSALGISLKIVSGSVFLAPASASDQADKPVVQPHPAQSAPVPMQSVQPLPPPPPPPLPIYYLFTPQHRTPEQICKLLFPSQNSSTSQTVSNAVPTSVKQDQNSPIAGPCNHSGPSVLLHLPERTLDPIKALLPLLDTPSNRVEISTALAEVTINTSKASGLRVVSSILGGTFELGSPSSALSTSALTFKAANFSLVLDALGTDSRVVQVVSPSGVVDSGEKLDLAIGDRQPTLSGILTTGTGAAQQSITYQQAGALLSVTPVVGGESIRLAIDSEVSTFSQTTTGITSSPTISQRRIQTALTVKSGQVVVLGGLRSSKDADGKSRLFDRWSIGASASNQITDLVLLVHAKTLD